MSRWISQFLRENRTYIIPNWSGVGLGVLFFTCLFCGALFNHPLIQFFGLILAILYLSGMVQSNSNLNGIILKRVEAPLSPAGQSIEISITIKNESQESRHHLSLSFDDPDSYSRVFISTLEAGETRLIKLKFPPLPRGKHSLRQIRISSEFPIGAFHTWKLWKPNYEMYIYPKAISLIPLPTNTERNANQGPDFFEHRIAPVDAPAKSIDWKKYAKSSIKLLKIFEDETRSPIKIQWNDLQALPLESKLSQFTQWILELEKLGIQYSLEAPFVDSSSTSHPPRKDHYLKAMSTYKESQI